MLTNKDLENGLKQYEIMLFESEAEVEARKKKLEFCKERIAAMPEEDPMPEEAKEVEEALK